MKKSLLNNPEVKQIAKDFFSYIPQKLNQGHSMDSAWKEYVEENEEEEKLSWKILSFKQVRGNKYIVTKNNMLCNGEYTGAGHVNITKIEKGKGLDYEITAWKYNDRIILKSLENKFEYEDHRLSNDYLSNKTKAEIDSVKRLSDGIEFSVGDKTTRGEILGFHISQDKIWAYIPGRDMGGTRPSVELCDLTKNKALFITEDGVEIFEGDRCFYVYQDNSGANSFMAREYNCASVHDARKFSSKEAAEQYLYYNKPTLSIREVEDKIMAFDLLMHLDNREKLVKSIHEVVAFKNKS